MRPHRQTLPLRIKPAAAVILWAAALTALAEPGAGGWALGRVEAYEGRETAAAIDPADPATWPVYRFDVWRVAKPGTLKARFTGTIRVACYGPAPGDPELPPAQDARTRTLRPGDALMILLDPPAKKSKTYLIPPGEPALFQIADEIPREEAAASALDEIAGLGLFYIETNLAESLAIVARRLKDLQSETLDAMLVNISITPQTSMEIAALAVRTLRGDTEARADFLNRLAVDKAIAQGPDGETHYGGEPIAPFMQPEDLLTALIADALKACQAEPQAALIAQDPNAPHWLRTAARP